MKQNAKKHYECVLVTGATKGIGLAFAREFAHQKCRLVIVARGEELLHSVAERLRAEGAAEVIPLVCDLSAEGSAGWLYEECRRRGLGIDLLVNNAGMFAYCDQTKMEQERVDKMLQLHIVSTTELSRRFGANMAERGHGAIVNLSSYAANMAWPGLAVYGATKGYIDMYTRALAHEMRERGVKVLSVMPAGVATDLYGLPEKWQRRALRWGVLWSAQKVAKGSLRALHRGQVRYVPGVINRLMAPIVRHVPKCVISFLRRRTLVFQK